MRYSPLRYLFWVLLPVGSAALLGQWLAQRESEALAVESTSRIAHLAAGMVAQEMGILVAELEKTAPELSDPDPASPLIQAALRGDTVAALGSSSGELTLSVALVEGLGDSLRVRATTAPFRPTTLGRIPSRTGRGVAIYLRGTRAVASPEDFGPPKMGNEAEVPGSQRGRILPPQSGLVPLVPVDRGTSPALILSGPLHPLPRKRGFRSGLLILLLAWGGGVLAWMALSSGTRGASRGDLRRLPLLAIPLLVLWSSVIWTGQSLDAAREELEKGDMVRVLALVGDGENSSAPEEIREGTGFQVVRYGAGAVVNSTLPEGPLLTAIAQLPLPPPTFPSLGELQSPEGRRVYATLREGPGHTITLVAPPEEGKSRSFLLLLAALAGSASLLGLVFLRSPAGEREE